MAKKLETSEMSGGYQYSLTILLSQHGCISLQNRATNMISYPFGRQAREPHHICKQAPHFQAILGDNLSPPLIRRLRKSDLEIPHRRCTKPRNNGKGHAEKRPTQGDP
jgi:hypothetical protein